MNTKKTIITISSLMGLGIAVIGTGLLLSGCGGDQTTSAPPQTSPDVNTAGPAMDPGITPAGGALTADPASTASADPNATPGAPSSSPKYAYRKDPFAPRQEEVEINKVQVVNIVGLPGVIAKIAPPADTQPPKIPPYEQQPYRRLAGVISGDVMAAILETYYGEGIEMRIIWPGIAIGEWQVTKLTPDYAVLTRQGEKNPKEIIVRREVPPGR